MPFIKVQNLKKDEKGNITGGTASIIDVECVPAGKMHSVQKPREPLRKVLWLSEDRRKGGIQVKDKGRHRI